MAPSSSISKAEWQKHEATIRDLYIVKNMTLNMLMQEMSSIHGFFASKYQYTTQLKGWRLQKNSTKDFWRGLDGSLKRKRLKPSEAKVYSNGRSIPLKKLKKELPRYTARAGQPSDDIPAPATPEGLKIHPILEHLRSNEYLLPRSLTILLPWHSLVELTTTTYKPPILPLTDLPVASPTSTDPLERNFSYQTQDKFDLFHGISPVVPLKELEIPLSTHIDIFSEDPESNKVLGLMPSPNEVMKFLGCEREIAHTNGDGRAALERHIRPFVIERQPGETKRAVRVLMNPCSAASTTTLMSYIALLASNDLINDEAMQAFLARAEKTQQLGIIKALLIQRSPSAKAVATRLLHAAIDINATEFLRTALENGADSNSPSTGIHSLTRFQKAFSSGKFEAARILMDAGANTNLGVDSRNGEEACEHQKCYGKSSMCGCQVTEENSSIVLAAKLDAHKNLISKLLGKGAIKSNHVPVLLHAISNNAGVDVVSSLIDDGADVDQCSPSKFTEDAAPLCAAARRKNLLLLRLLLEKGASPDGPLSSENSQLLRRRFKIYRKGDSPLVSALMGRHYDRMDMHGNNRYNVVQLLLKYGANPNISSMDINLQESLSLTSDDILEGSGGYHENGILILYALQAAARLGDIKLVKLLLHHKASPNTTYGTPPLTLAVVSSDLKMARFLLSQGADPNGLGAHDSCRSALEAAVEGENLEIINLLLEAGADINRCSAFCGGRTPLQRAAQLSNERVIDHLLKHGASMLSKPAPAKGASVLYYFVRNRLHNYVSTALKAGASPNTYTEDEYSPLVAAIMNNDTVSLNFLLSKGAFLQEYGKTRPTEEDTYANENDLEDLEAWELSPIQRAAAMGHIKVARILCKAGADVNQLPNGSHGDTALNLAICRKKYAMAEFLVAQGASVNARWDPASPLINAIKSSDERLTGLLLKNGANPDWPSRLSTGPEISDHFTPLEFACACGEISVVKTLLNCGADASRGCPLRSVFEGVEWVYQRSSSELQELVEVLLEHGANVNTRDDNKDTPLQQAINSEEFICAYQLIEIGACINAPASTGRWGRTAFQAAASVGSLGAIEYLLSKGADVNAPAAPDHGVTALQAAAIKGYLGIAQILLEHGADIDAEAAIVNGRTAVDGAAEFGRIDMVKFLLDNYHGPELSAVIKNAYNAAKKSNQWYVMELLEITRNRLIDVLGEIANVMLRNTHSQTPRRRAIEYKVISIPFGSPGYPL